jgi:hypothetical protein
MSPATLRAMRALLLLLLLPSLSPCADPNLSVSVSGLQINAEVPAMSDGGQPFTFESGTKVKLLISSPSGGLVSCDEDASTVTVLKDDKGTDLLAKGKGSPSSPLSPFSRISDDHKFLEIEARAEKIPLKGSSTLFLAGVLSVQLAHAQNTISRPLKLVNGASATFGTLTFTVDKVGKPEWGDDPMAFTVKIKGDVAQVATIVFTKADGSPIEVTHSSSFHGGPISEWTYNMKETADSLTMTTTLWNDLKKVEVPFDLTIDVGL